MDSNVFCGSLSSLSGIYNMLNYGSSSACCRPNSSSCRRWKRELRSPFSSTHRTQALPFIHPVCVDLTPMDDHACPHLAEWWKLNDINKEEEAESADEWQAFSCSSNTASRSEMTARWKIKMLSSCLAFTWCKGNSDLVKVNLLSWFPTQYQNCLSYRRKTMLLKSLIFTFNLISIDNL